MITSDHWPQFTSNVWSQLCEMLYIMNRQTTAYHPESNGAVERLHASKGCATPSQTAAPWAEEITWVIFSLHAKLRKDTGLSPAEAVFGAPIVCQINFYKEMKFLLTQFQSFFLNLWRRFLRFFLPRHNLSRQLPSEVPAYLHSARLIWV
jgi:transposase InsO family protein